MSHDPADQVSKAHPFRLRSERMAIQPACRGPREEPCEWLEAALIVQRILERRRNHV